MSGGPSRDTTSGKGARGGRGGDGALSPLDRSEHPFSVSSFKESFFTRTFLPLLCSLLFFSLLLSLPSSSFCADAPLYTLVSASRQTAPAATASTAGSKKTGEDVSPSSSSSLPEKKSNLCQLTGLELSSGRLPNFDVRTLEYTINLTTQQSEIILLPRFQCPRDIPSRLLPSVTIEGQNFNIHAPLGVKVDLDPNQKYVLSLSFFFYWTLSTRQSEVCIQPFYTLQAWPRVVSVLLHKFSFFAPVTLSFSISVVSSLPSVIFSVPGVHLTTRPDFLWLCTRISLPLSSLPACRRLHV